MPTIGRNTKTTELNKLTNDEIQARWARLTPTFFRYLLISVAVTVGTFGYNHFVKPGQRVTDISNVVFQISAIFAVCFVFLTLASLYFRSGAWRSDRKKKA